MSKYKDSDKEAFDRIAQAILNWRDATIDLAAVIVEAKEREIWKLKYDSWNDFCQLECGITKRWANKLVVASKAMVQIANFEPPKVLQINGTSGNDVPTFDPQIPSVAAAVELASVPTENQPAVLASAVSSGKVTAKSIAAAASVAVPIQDVKDIRKDAVGRTIPADVIADWDRAAKVASTLRGCASEIKVTVERGLADKDIVFAEITNPTIAEAASLHYTLSQIAPHAVCPCCQGKLKKNCQLCRKRGYISKYLWNSPAVSAETKSIIEKVTKR